MHAAGKGRKGTGGPNLEGAEVTPRGAVHDLRRGERLQLRGGGRGGGGGGAEAGGEGRRALGRSWIGGELVRRREKVRGLRLARWVCGLVRPLLSNGLW